MIRTLSISVLALSLAACGGGAGDGNKATSTSANVAAPAGSAWTDTASKTEAGGFVIGNPNAAVKLIEYGALSCSHCAEFSEKSHEKLMGYVVKGTVSYEYRPFLLNALDVPSFLLARCAGPRPFFTIAEQLYADQRNWLGKTQSFTEEEQKSWQGLPPEQLGAMLAGKLGLDTFVQERGVGAEQAKACLADKAAIEELSKITQTGVNEFKVTGTPTFVLDGKTLDVNTWEALDPLLIAAGA